MARPPLPLGTWGKIRHEERDGYVIARARFRDYDGVTRDVTRVGRSRAAASDALTTALRDRSMPPGQGILTGESTVAELVATYLQNGRDAGTWSANTRSRYEDMERLYIVPSMGRLRLREATVPRVDGFLKGVAKRVGAPTARLCKSVLSGAFALAVRQGALAYNPAHNVEGIADKRPEPKALTAADVRALRASAARFEHEPTRRVGRETRHPGMVALVDVLLGTGVRIGEALALRWSEVDLDAGTIRIEATVIRPSGTRPERQPHPKTDNSRRTLTLPPFALGSLLDLRVRMTHANAGDLVFPSAAGTLRDPSNTRKAWNTICEGAGLVGVTPHAIRRTVATVIDRESDTQTAATQLGSTATVTGRHYVERQRMGPDMRETLERFVTG